MPPRNRRVGEPVSDEASTQPQNVAPRGRGCGRGYGRGRLGSGGGMLEVEVPRATRGNPTLAQLMANMNNPPSLHEIQKIDKIRKPRVVSKTKNSSAIKDH